jgi:hypothetical protein
MYRLFSLSLRQSSAGATGKTTTSCILRTFTQKETTAIISMNIADFDYQSVSLKLKVGQTLMSRIIFQYSG